MQTSPTRLMNGALAFSAMAVLATATAASCSPYAGPRSQLLVLVTTDLALPIEVANDPSISGAATIDRVRAEVLADDGTVQATRSFIVTSPSDLPVSFGVEVRADVATYVRVTGYRDHLTITRSGPIDPSPLASVTRLVRARAADGEVRHVSIVLRGECLALPPDLRAGTTCAETESEDASLGTSEPSLTPATWDKLHETPCESATPSGMRCIPGGLTDVGAQDLEEVDPNSDFIPSPPRLALVAPLFMDTLEVSVQAFRTIYAQKHLTATLPTAASENAACNYGDPASDKQAVRCVPFETARAVCRARGMELPTLAQWEHAARGRGRNFRYPWGNGAPECCVAALGSIVAGLDCVTSLDVGTHAVRKGCPSHDVSIDGVQDLGGSVREWVIDAATSTATCEPAGLLAADGCSDPSTPPGSTKGGSFRSPLEGASSALRRAPADLADVGFRCVR